MILQKNSKSKKGFSLRIPPFNGGPFNGGRYGYHSQDAWLVDKGGSSTLILLPAFSHGHQGDTSRPLAAGRHRCPGPTDFFHTLFHPPPPPDYISPVYSRSRRFYIEFYCQKKMVDNFILIQQCAEWRTCIFSFYTMYTSIFTVTH